MRSTVFVFFLSVSFLSRGQEGQFSQYFATNGLLNPAFVGVIPNLLGSTNIKTNTSPSSQSFQELLQFSLSYPFIKETSLDHQTGGIGLTIFRERRGFQGLYVTQKVLGTGAYRLRLSERLNHHIIFGLQAGVVQAKIDGSNLQWGSQYNRFLGSSGGFDNTLPSESVSDFNQLYPVFNFGVIYTFYDNENFLIRDKQFIVGLSVDNLNRPTISNSAFESIRKNLLYKAFTSIKLDLSPRWFLHPSSMLLLSTGSTQLNFGTILSTYLSSAKSKWSVQLEVGSWYRLGDSFILLAGMQVDNFRVGASFDLNNQSFQPSETPGAQIPSYEISLTYNLDLSRNLKSIPSPIF